MRYKEKKNPKVTKVPWRNNSTGEIYYDHVNKEPVYLDENGRPVLPYPKAKS